MPSLKIDTITVDDFNDTLSRYKTAVPKKLHELDTMRYETIPFRVRPRKRPSPQLSKEHMEQLVEWKLKHGTFRPKLLQLVQSNDADLVLQTTEEAFAPILKYDNVDISDASGESDMIGDANKSLKVLTALKGVGPATASLLLSVVAPTRIPFFSDELFRWAMFDESGSPGGWKRTIKYNAKEYNELIKKVDVLVSRLGVRALDAEKVAYVLGKEGADLADGNEDRAAQQSTTIEPVTTLKKEDSKPEVEEPKIEEPKKGTKRKQSTSKPQTEGMRKSTRTKK